MYRWKIAHLNLTIYWIQLGFCIDEHGVYHGNHGTWTTGDCKTCTCQVSSLYKSVTQFWVVINWYLLFCSIQNGNLSCKKVECPPLSCETAINGEECCSVCKEWLFHKLKWLFKFMNNSPIHNITCCYMYFVWLCLLPVPGWPLMYNYACDSCNLTLIEPRNQIALVSWIAIGGWVGRGR